MPTLLYFLLSICTLMWFCKMHTKLQTCPLRAKFGQSMCNRQANSPLQQSRLACRSTQKALRILASSAANHQSVSAVSVPLCHYSILQLDRKGARDLKQTAQAAYEKLLGTPTLAAYTADTLFSRAILLKSAAECLGDIHSRKGYDNKLILGMRDVKVSHDDITGALVLLQESGNHEEAIELGTRLLQNEPNEAQTADIVTCVALAYCDRAAIALETASSSQKQHASRKTSSKAAQPMVLEACQALEQGLALCREHDVAPVLQEHIADALKTYCHQYCTELLALPLEEAHASQRQHGFQLLKDILAQPLPDTDEHALKMQINKVADLVQNAREVMTAAEQIQLYNALKASPAVTSSPAILAGVQYDTAMAYVADGCLKGWPHYLHQADLLLQAAEQYAGDNDQQKGAVTLERGCIAVMLGRMKQAQAVLGLEDDGSGQEHADPQVVEFVQANSGNSSDLAQGLQALTKGWLSEAVLATFRECQETRDGIAASNKDVQQGFFVDASPAAKLYLQVYQMTQVGPVLQLLHALCMMHSLMQATITNARMLTERKQNTLASSRLLSSWEENDRASVPPETKDSLTSTARLTRSPSPILQSEPASIDLDKKKEKRISPAAARAKAVLDAEALLPEPTSRSSPAKAVREPSPVGQETSKRLSAVSNFSSEMQEHTLIHEVTTPVKRRRVITPPLMQPALPMMSEMAAAEYGLRRQLGHMERDMWDSARRGPQSLPQAILCGLMRLLGIAAFVGLGFAAIVFQRGSYHVTAPQPAAVTTARTVHVKQVAMLG